MLIAAREFMLAGRGLGVGDEIPSDLWTALRERTRRVLTAQKFVREAPARTRDSRASEAPRVVTIPPTVTGFPCDVCGESFESKQALGGHRRGHSKRGESSIPATSRRAARV